MLRRKNEGEQSPPKRHLALPLLIFASLLAASVAMADTEKKPQKPKARLTLARAPLESANGVDIRRVAPLRPAGFTPRESLAQPKTSGDLNAISQDWLLRQSSLLTDGADQKLVADINRSMNRMLKWEDVVSEPWPEPGEGGESSGSQPGPQPDPQTDSAETGRFFLKPRAMRFAQVNRLIIDWSHDISLTCATNGSAMLVNVTTPLGSNTFLDLEHNSSRGANTLHFNYSW